MMNATLFTSALVLGLAGSLHCLGMCGPLAAAIPGGQRRFGNPHLARSYYHLGRIATYALLGLVAGSLGHAFRQVGWQRAVSIVAGILLIAGIAAGPWLINRSWAQILLKRLQRVTGIFIREGRSESMLIAGMLNGLLPCGLVYTAMAASTVAPSPTASAGFMAIFGLGTTPALFAVSMLSGAIQDPRRRLHFAKAAPVLTVMAGLFLILRGMSLGIPYLSPDFSGEPNAKGSCCSHHQPQDPSHDTVPAQP